jgi:hypothetical protein
MFSRLLGALRGRQSASLRHEREFARDFSSPQGALLVLEDAYRAGDVEAVVAAKDFTREAELMLARLPIPSAAADPELVAKTAETLELAFRAELRSGFPNVTGTESTFSDATPYPGPAGVVVVTEVVRYPDGGSSRQEMLVAQTSRGWRVLIPLASP